MYSLFKPSMIDVTEESGTYEYSQKIKERKDMWLDVGVKIIYQKSSEGQLKLGQIGPRKNLTLQLQNNIERVLISIHRYSHFLIDTNKILSKRYYILT